VIATAAPLLPTADELATRALARLEKAVNELEKPLTVARVHVIKQHLAVVKLTLLTSPLRPRQVP